MNQIVARTSTNLLQFLCVWMRYACTSVNRSFPSIISVTKDDPIVEYEDEFGRMRTARRSEVPRNLQRSIDKEPEPEDEYVSLSPLVHNNPLISIS